MMDEVFGKFGGQSLFLPKLEWLFTYFDTGLFVIVPNPPEMPLTERLLHWINSEILKFEWSTSPLRI